MVLLGKVRCPNVYADGTNNVEIHFSLDCIEDLPIVKNQRASINLVVNGSTYHAGIRHTDNNKYIWISPDCEFNGKKMRLSDVIFNAGFKRNDEIFISFEGLQGTVIV